ncbi:hypothetical protein HDU83_005024 [Entophlyctis luteolus]|nr:hypothetical protein HDU83_005024 [Entophlyctis luteolus]
MPFVQQLPPVDDIHADTEFRAEFISRIRSGICECVAAGDIHGATFWARKIDALLTLKVEITQNDRVFLVSSLVALTSLPGIDLHLAQSFASVGERLAKKVDHLPIGCLVIEWRPLWEQVKRVVFPKGRSRIYPSDLGHVGEIIKFVRKVSHQLASSFLTDYTSAISESETGFTLFFSMSLLSRLAVDQVSHPEYIGWTDEMLSFVYEAGFRALELPMTQGSSNGGRRKSKDIFRFLARLAVSTMYLPTTPGGGKYNPPSASLPNLKKLLLASETHFHPSNAGPWSFKLAYFLSELSNSFLIRWRREQLPDCETPVDLRVTKELKSDFIRTIVGPAFLSILSKDQRAVAEANKAIKSLAFLDEDGVVLGKVIDGAYSGLETLTESFLSNLGFTAVPLVTHSTFPSGSKHLVPLLSLALPGIDMNDPMKTVSTLIFISNAFMVVPIVDLSKYSRSNQSETNVDTILSTAQFADWVLLFLDKIYSLLQNLPQIHGVTANTTMETMLTSIATHSLQIAFQQMDPEIHALALGSLAKFVLNTTIPSATKSIGRIVAISGGARPDLKLKYLLRPVAEKIRAELSNPGGIAKSSLANVSFPFSFASMSDSEFHWSQYIFLNTIVNSESAILEHQNLVRTVIREMVQVCRSYRAVKWTAKTLEVTIGNSVGIYPRDFRSVESSVWQSPELTNDGLKFWGQKHSADSFKVDWHIPTDEELDFGISLISEFSKLCTEALIATLKDSDKTSSSMGSEHRDQSFEFSRWLTVLKSIVAAVSGLIAPWDDISPLSAVPVTKLACGDSFDFEKPKCGYLSRKHKRFQEVAELRKSIGDLLLSLAEHFASRREDDVVPIMQLIKDIEVFISFRGVRVSSLANMVNGYKYVKSIVSTSESQKMLPRYLLVKRAHTKDLLMKLLELSISRYSEVRKRAQSALGRSIVPFEALKKEFFVTLLDRLVDSSAPEHVVKGCLHMCSSGIVQDLYYKDLECAMLFARAICKPFGDKPSIQETVRRIFVTFLRVIGRLSVAFNVSQECRLVIKNQAADPSLILRGENVVKEQIIRVRTEYERFVQSMVEFIDSPTTHWRARAMAMNMLEALFDPDSPPQLGLVKIVLSGLVSSHPTFRDASTTFLIRILRCLKARAKKSGIDQTSRLKVVSDLNGNVNVEEFLDRSVGDTASFIHDSSIVGWYCWPKTIKVYQRAASRDDKKEVSGVFELPFYDTESVEVLNYMYEVVKSSDFWEKISQFHSQESSKDSERFNTDLFDVVRALAGQFEDLFSVPLKKIILVLAQETKDKSKQRAATEFLAGLVRGSKNWNQSKSDTLWSWVMPVIQNAVETCGVDTSAYWIELVTRISVNRDPRRLQPIIDHFLNWNFDMENLSFFNESKKMMFINVIVRMFSWKLTRRYPQLLGKLFEILAHPYQQVRENLGSLIELVLGATCVVSAPSVTTAILWNIASMGGLAGDAYSGKHNIVIPSPSADVQMITKLQSDLAKWHGIKRANTVDPSDYANACKTVIVWWAISFSQPSMITKFVCLDFQLQEIFRMIEYDDVELQNSASKLSVLFANMAIPEQLLSPITDKILDILKGDAKWQTKLKVMTVIQILFFKNALSLSAKQKAAIFESISLLLEHPQVEVRSLAGTTLSGFVRFERDSIGGLQTRFERALKVTKAAKKKSTLPQRAADVTNNGSDSPSMGVHPLVIQRHAAVIGLCSLVLAFPYDIPAWMPEVLVVLSTCISDQAPISATVSKTFADFRRTHQDTWKQDGITHFTEDQLSSLSDLLISSSYYA